MASSLGRLVLIIGPSGVGKSVILQKLRERHPEFHFPRSATTRLRRDGEGDDLYRFVSESEFDALIREGQLLEWAEVHGKPKEEKEYVYLGSVINQPAGARYGTLVDEIVPFIERGKTVIREVDVQGFDRIRRHHLFAGKNPPCMLHSIFILPESKDQLIQRIRNRAPISNEELERRIDSMDQEMEYARLCDKSIPNREGELPDTVLQVEKSILSAQ